MALVTFSEFEPDGIEIPAKLATPEYLLVIPDELFSDEAGARTE